MTVTTRDRAHARRRSPDLAETADRNEELHKTFAWFKEMPAGIGVNLESATYRLGRPLKFDPQQEKFLGDPEADKLLTREYREPFVVPAEV